MVQRPTTGAGAVNAARSSFALWCRLSEAHACSHDYTCRADRWRVRGMLKRWYRQHEQLENAQANMAYAVQREHLKQVSAFLRRWRESTDELYKLEAPLDHSVDPISTTSSTSGRQVLVSADDLLAIKARVICHQHRKMC